MSGCISKIINCNFHMLTDKLISVNPLQAYKLKIYCKFYKPYDNVISFRLTLSYNTSSLTSGSWLNSFANERIYMSENVVKYRTDLNESQ